MFQKVAGIYNYQFSVDARFFSTKIIFIGDYHEGVVLDNFAGGKKDDRILEGAKYIDGDIRNEKDLEKACKGVDGIFHMAALPRVTFSVENPELTHDVNVNGTLKVLLAAKKYGVKRVVFSSSSSTYGNQEIMPLVETMTPDPIS